MNEQEQRIAIAEFCGYVRILGDPWKMMGEIAWFPLGWDVSKFINWGEPALYVDDLPDYLNDLNAIHEAEKMLTDIQWKEYEINLRMVCFSSSWYGVVGKKLIHASALRKSKALLLTLGLWKD